MDKVNYNQISKVYDQVRDADLELIKIFIETGRLNQRSKILDIGCGTANYTDLLQKITSADVYGVDASAGMIEKGKAKNGQIMFNQVDVSTDQLPYHDNFFNFIYMTDVIHHIKDLDNLFSEINRVLNQQGLVCISTQSHRQIDKRYLSEFFPATAVVDKQRYPSIEIIIETAEKFALKHMKTINIFEDEEIELGQNFLNLIAKKGYSMLHLIEEADYQLGVEKIKKSLLQGKLIRKSAGGSLVWFSKSLS